ncbi:3'-5' exonuclease [Venenivibrio stagnispumantis]|uniref:DNA 3'-5' helicase n=1 Tax=Venenivibrio stagnispumantis TaxID=407998 RepID=A0AA45WKK0_9AQUI|nr:UvrD-helicase domain-containing protein [Venenivibrio stagnispumantis]MCW4573001.1 UvrD-helicase domain-containing protein [Venenivibrio stagnispumantis]SMP07866.1 DNA helicase-2 / ATP-dependent DNA helicase PcrA [Venenivibrio stagnispumantis]
MDILKGLNEAQKEAVLYLDSPLLVLAGAGSGKTKVITHKIAYLMQNGINKILAITFTNKAANEMKERVENLIKKENPYLWIMTFHSFSAKFLRFEAKYLGLKPNFAIYDEEDSKKILKEVLKELNLDTQKLELYKDKISKIKQDNNPDLFMIYNLTVPMLKPVFEKYQEKLEENNALDFDDLLIKTVYFLENDRDLLSKWQAKFDYILVDEYQDTNVIQHKLLKLLLGNRTNITVVGDPAQCIYTWRGAHPENILNFDKEFPNTKIIKLEKNYRSTKKILNIANKVISKISNRWKDKVLTLHTDKEEGEEIIIHKAISEKEEARYIASRIKELISKGKNYSDIAILIRMSFLSRNIEEALLREKIPYQIVAGTRFFERMEIKDLMAYIRLAVNPQDFASFERAITTPPKGIADKTLQKIKTYYKTDWIQALKDFIINEKKKSKIRVNAEEFISVMLFIEENLNKPSYLIKQLYQMINYEDYLKEHYPKDYEDRKENINELFRVFEEVEKQNKSIEDFLEETTLQSAQDNLENSDKVKVMTIHASKGLEFPVVFLPSLEEGIFPAGKSLYDKTQLEEERRLFYVAVTRAKEILFLSYAKNRAGFSAFKSFETKPSRFIEEIEKSGLIKSSKPKTEKPKTERQKIEKPQVKTEDNRIKQGDIVYHDIFGKGFVKSADNKKAVVLFENHGEKTILLEFLKKR